MLQKKVCMLGAYAVGKTSLVARFVSGIFSEKYLSTVGVKIDRRDVDLDGTSVRLVLWDLQGEDEYQTVRSSYLRGAAGMLYVVDGTRPETLPVALELRARVRRELGDVPGLVLLNKADLASRWVLDDAAVADALEGGSAMRTSARTGDNVEEAFRRLAALVAR